MNKFVINQKTYSCPVTLALEVIGGKWKLLILYNLKDGLKRYGELKKALPDATHKMLTQQLRELEEDGIVNRMVYAVVPPKVEYSLTERGTNLQPVIALMAKWGMDYKIANELAAV